MGETALESEASVESNLGENDPWWTPESELFAMGVLLNQMRYPYFFDVLTRKLMHAPAELSVLDVGCGGGSLSLLFSRSGFAVTGVDPDPIAIRSATNQAEKIGVDATFKTAAAESLPFGAATFDVVVASEVLEHVSHIDLALDELYRVLKFGGVLLFSTPNRSVLSYLLLVKVAQDWKPTRILTQVEHEYGKLRKPSELQAALETRGIDVFEMSGVSVPISAFPSAVLHYWRHKTGRSPLSHLAASLRLRAGGSMALAYIGWGVKYG